MSTKIQWTDETWNPIIGCSKISPGCVNCYAETMATRLAAMSIKKVIPSLNGYPEIIFGRKWNGKVVFMQQAISKPLAWRKPRKIFVCSMGDLFHESVPFEWIDMVMAIIACTPHHTYQILTKRPDRMAEYFSCSKDMLISRWENAIYKMGICDKNDDLDSVVCYIYNRSEREWPLNNVWLGVTAENQEQANKRIPILLQIPSVIKFVSIEPMIDYVRLVRFLPELHWVICGGESGQNARPINPDWVRNLRDACEDYERPFFFKSWGKFVEIFKIDTATAVINTKRCKLPDTIDDIEYKQFPNHYNHEQNER